MRTHTSCGEEPTEELPEDVRYYKTLSEVRSLTRCDEEHLLEKAVADEDPEGQPQTRQRRFPATRKERVFPPSVLTLENHAVDGNGRLKGENCRRP